VHASTDLRQPVTWLSPFASPEHPDPVLRHFLHQVSDLLCEWIGTAAQRPPIPVVRPEPELIPGDQGCDVPALLNDLKIVMDGAYQPSHPGALSHLDPPPLTASIAADLICAGLNNNLLAEELSPGLSSLERQLCHWFAQRLGLPEKAGGVLATGGTLSNLMALVTARSLQGSGDGVILCSRDAHVSLLKATRVMGLASDALMQLPVDREGRLCSTSLEQTLQDLHLRGRPCLAVVATAGTTIRGAIDPLAEIASVCRRHEVWLHVDAAIGGVFALSEDWSPLFRGLEQADSITLNPQKLLGIAKASSLLLVRDLRHLHQSFSTGLPYMDGANGEPHGGELGLQGTRPAEVLKLWLGLRQLGEQGIAMVLRSALERRDQVRRRLDQDRFTLLDGSLHLLSLHPRAADADDCDTWSQTTRHQLLGQGFLLSRPRYGDRFCLKAVFGNPHTAPEHLDRLAELINASLV
jgi:glutamate/tyrosine decarboxylase-like PLP-dependent enzyme